jgi:hypothetical protein
MNSSTSKVAHSVLTGLLSSNPQTKAKARRVYNRIASVAGLGSPAARDALYKIHKGAHRIRKDEAEVLGLSAMSHASLSSGGSNAGAPYRAFAALPTEAIPSISSGQMFATPPGSFSTGQPVFQAGPFQSSAIPSIPGLTQHILPNSQLNASLATATQTAALAAQGLVNGPYGPYNPNNPYDPNNPNNPYGPNSMYSQGGYGGGGGGDGGYNGGCDSNNDLNGGCDYWNDNGGCDQYM